MKLTAQASQCGPEVGCRVSAEVRRPPGPFDVLLAFECLEPVPHVLHEHFGGGGELGVVHVVRRTSLQSTEGLEDQPLAAFEFHGNSPFDRWSRQKKQRREFTSRDNNRHLVPGV